MSNNSPAMELSPEQVDELEGALERLSNLDPASLPPPATELADLLSRILEQLEGS